MGYEQERQPKHDREQGSRFGLVGENLQYSYSKRIHESLGRYDYELISMDRVFFGTFIANRQYDGLNITIPYKREVISYCDEVSELARRIGAVNTLYFRGGKLCGTNTDYAGFLYGARAAGIDFGGKKVLILGNGGTSLMVRQAVADARAAQILITTRRGEPGCIAYEELPAHPDIEIIINTTPVGTYPRNGQQLIDLSAFPACQGVIDVIYNPFATALLQQAQKAGIPHTNGLPMLVAQATAAAEYFLNETGPTQQNAAIIDRLRRDIENIVLIGMPGCGKSSLGRAVAARLDKTFVDMDAEIERTYGQPIPQIFAEKGEAFFRDLETGTAKRLGKENGQVIATGGGVILRPENMKALSQNGRVVFIERPLESLATDGRPLSRDLAALENMYKVRLPLYRQYGELRFSSVPGIEASAKQLTALLTAKS